MTRRSRSALVALAITASLVGVLAIGLERVVMALFKTHGFVVEKWPASVRARLWP